MEEKLSVYERFKKKYQEARDRERAYVKAPVNHVTGEGITPQNGTTKKGCGCGRKP